MLKNSQKSEIYGRIIVMKKAFSLIELVMVVVVIGIIAALAIPRANRDSLREAADQILAHIQYTQHLAMQNNMFSTTDEEWYKKRWSISFGNSKLCYSTTNNEDCKKAWHYNIFRDLSLSGNANSPTEIAKDPQNPDKFLSAGWSGLSEGTFKRKTTKKLNLSTTFGLDPKKDEAIKFKDCPVDGSTTLAFDYLGRPMMAISTTGNGGLLQPYEQGRLLQKDCNITISNGTDSISIIIKPETGYAEIEDNRKTII